MTESTTVVLFPHTLVPPAARGTLLPWCESMLLVLPPSLEPEPADALEQAGLLSQARPSAGDPDETRRLQQLVRQWEQWAAAHQGSSQAEMLKAGVEPPPPPETVRSLIRDIKQFGRRQPAPGSDRPEPTGDILLHLAHLREKQAREAAAILARVEEKERTLGQVMGLDQPDTTPADYEQAFGDRLPPLDYRLDQTVQLQRRLSAWADLAARVPQAQDRWLATASLPALQMLLERRNRALSPLESELRSPAGAAMPLGPAQLHPSPDSPLAQEAARLVLPDLGHLEPAAQAELIARLDPQALSKLRHDLGRVLVRLATEPWGEALQKELAQAARALAECALELAAAAGADPDHTRGVSIVAFPGLSRDQLLALMRQEEPTGLPGYELWPEKWPAGSCPVLAVW
jgi:hypothetical protein